MVSSFYKLFKLRRCQWWHNIVMCYDQAWRYRDLLSLIIHFKYFAQYHLLKNPTNHCTALPICIYICYFVYHHSSCLSPQTLLLSSWCGFSVILFPLQWGPGDGGHFGFYFCLLANWTMAQLWWDRSSKQLWELNILIIIPSTYFLIFAPQSTSLGSWSSGNSSVSPSHTDLTQLSETAENTSKPVMSSLFLGDRNIKSLITM